MRMSVVPAGEAGGGQGLRVEAPAKINLRLDVQGERPDGFHDIDSLFLAISLADVLEARPRARDGDANATESAAADRLRIVPRRLDVAAAAAGGAAAPGEVPLPPVERNLVLRAAEFLRAEAAAQGRPPPPAVDLVLSKSIPMGAGLGGGSTDAAAALLGLDRLWGLGLGTEKLAAIGARLGSDVPFFLTGGLARCRGRGERVEAIDLGGREGNAWVVLVSPRLEVPTPLVYGALRDERRATLGKPRKRRRDTLGKSRERRRNTLGKSRERRRNTTVLTPPKPLTTMRFRHFLEGLAAAPCRRSGDAFGGASGVPSGTESGMESATVSGATEDPVRDAATAAAPEKVSGDLEGLAFSNTLQEVAFRLFPVLRGLAERLAGEAFTHVQLTGSGSTLFGLCASHAAAAAIAARLARAFEGGWRASGADRGSEPLSIVVHVAQGLPSWRGLADRH